MAQIQKDEVREAIVRSAKEEFLAHGYEKASMRSIAVHSRMTVGNLYRYFKSKEELNSTIVSPTYSAINSLVEKLTGGKVHLGRDAEALPQSADELRSMLKALSDGLVDIYRKHRIEVNILMMGSKLNKELTEWFSSIIAGLIAKYYNYSEDDSTVMVLSKCYADAIFGGIRTILSEAPADDEKLKNVIRIYLDTYVTLLDKDIASFA